jgi:glycosyltransferase involved in cell wall biosynthesis
MVLIEAMASGLPVLLMIVRVGRECFNSWRRWILIENGNEMDYVNAVETLKFKIKKEMGEKSKVSSENTRSILLWKLGINYLSDYKELIFLL